MTSEVCIMNRLAVVLAADSASTVTYWGERGQEQRYFKGANKIFQLSNNHPVGLMIFDSADILRVPWEIVVKSFRAFLGDKEFNTLGEYAAEFFSFMNESPRLFPEDVQKSHFVDAARGAAVQFIVRTQNAKAENKQQAMDAAVEVRWNELEAMPLTECVPAEAAASIVANWSGEVTVEVADFAKQLNSDEELFVIPSDLEKLAKLAIWEVLKKPDEYLGTTGLVFAGYGAHDYFPRMIEYKSAGMISGHHVSTCKQELAINHENPAVLSAFAQTEMTDTFSKGLSLDVYSSLMLSVYDGLKELAELACEKCGRKPGEVDLDQVVKDARGKISKGVLERANAEHAIPMRRVLGALPVDEMAGLAETLIDLQSLKEKVTKPSETVAGPVDVAVITKAEGLVWVKRKLYFDAALNSRYMQRQARCV